MHTGTLMITAAFCLAGLTAAATDQRPAAAAAPACGVCGGSCGLEPVCVCEPATRKVKKTSYAMRCEPVCVADGRAGGHAAAAASCTATGCGCDGSCSSASIRMRKQLVKTVTEEEVDVIERKIEYRCRHCAGIEAAPSCSACAGHGPAGEPAVPWWRRLWPW